EGVEVELGEEQGCFIQGDTSEWDHLPLPDGSFKVGIDGGYVRHWLDKQHNFEVIVGKSMLSFEEGEEERVPSLKRFGFVQTLDTQSKRRLYEVLPSQGLQMNQEITFLSDGDDTLRKLQVELSPKAIDIFASGHRSQTGITAPHRQYRYNVVAQNPLEHADESVDTVRAKWSESCGLPATIALA